MVSSVFIFGCIQFYSNGKIHQDSLHTWAQVCLVSKQWNREAQLVHPLSLGIKAGQLEVVQKLLAQGCPVTTPIRGATRLLNCVDDYTPYLCAMDYGHGEIAALLQQRDGHFSDRFVAMKLLALTFDIGASFLVDGHLFKGEALGHFVHHHYLIPFLYHSLNAFFAENGGKSATRLGKKLKWTRDCTEQLLDALWSPMPHCKSCQTPRQRKARHAWNKSEHKQIWIYSETQAYKGRHWTSVVMSEDERAIGNRGLGSGDYPGVRVYSIPPGKNLNLQKEIHTRFLSMQEQFTGNCSVTGLEAAILGAIEKIFLNKYPDFSTNEIATRSQQLFQQILNFHHKQFLLSVIKHDDRFHYDPHLLIRVLAVFKSCKATAEQFCQFLFSKEGVNKAILNNTLDDKGLTPQAYAAQRRNSCFADLMFRQKP